MNTVETDHVDAELRLGVGSHHTRSVSSAADHRQQITIFHNGQICACDLTEIQARAIISLAKVEQQQREKPLAPFNQTIPPLKLPPQMLNSRMNMKHSLQRFLEKRKARISASAPFNPFTPREPPFSTALQQTPRQCSEIK